MATKRTNLKSQIKKQLNGYEPVLTRLDTQDSAVLEHLEVDVMYNADNYTTVSIYGVDVIVKIGSDNETRSR